MTDYMALSAELINKLDTRAAMVVIEKTYLEFFDQDEMLEKSMATLKLWGSQGITLEETEARLREAPDWGKAGIMAIVGIKILAVSEKTKVDAGGILSKIIFIMWSLGNGKNIDDFIPMMSELVHAGLIND